VSESRDVVVVGGGPAGTATAIFLKQQGHDVLLLDEARFPRDKVCGESVSPGAWPLLESLGAKDAIRELKPHPLRGMLLTSPAGRVVRGDYPEGTMGLGLKRSVLDAVLLALARQQGVEVEEGVRVTALEFKDGGVTGVVCSERHIGARLVVGADGRRSLVARRLGLLREHRRLRKFAVRGHFEDVEGLEERGEMHVGGGGYCGVAPLSPGSANVTFVLDRRDMAAASGNLAGFYMKTLRRWPGLAERLERARLVSVPRSIGPLALEAARVSAPGALLVGDSAGFYDPFTGEGVTLALRSARLASNVAHASLLSRMPLREYDRVRDQATREKFRFNRLVQSVVASPRLADFLGLRLGAHPSLASQLVRIAGDLAPAQKALDVPFLLRLLFS